MKYGNQLFVNTYYPNDIVRISIVIKEDVSKEQVIEDVKKVMKDSASFKIQSTTLGDNVFTADVAYSNIELIESVEGVDEVRIMNRVTLHEEKEENTVSVEVHENEKVGSMSIEVGLIATALVGAVILMVWGMKKLRSN